MKTLFGANWRTSLSGLIGVAATVISAQPQLVAFLPDALEGYVRGIAGLIAAISAGYFVLNAKDKQVTGGTVQQTQDGSVASPMSQQSSSAVLDTKQSHPA